MFKYVAAAWNAYKKNYLPLILAFILIIITSSAMFILGSFFTIFSANLEIELDKIISSLEVLSINPLNATPLTELLSVSPPLLLSLLVAVIITISFNAGFIGMIDEALRGKTSISLSKKSTFFKTIRKKWKSVVVANIIAYVIMWVSSSIMYNLLWIFYPQYLALSFSIAYLFVISLFLKLVTPSIVINNKKPFQAIQTSIETVRDRFLTFLFLILFYSVLAAFLALIPLFGFLIVIFIVSPMSTLSVVKFYKDRRK